jgi:hypothetical protein
MVVNVNGCGDVHGRDKAQAVSHSAARDNLLNLVGNMHHLAAFARLKNQIFGVAFHDKLLQCVGQQPKLPNALAFILPAIDQLRAPKRKSRKARSLPRVAQQERPSAEGSKQKAVI